MINNARKKENLSRILKKKKKKKKEKRLDEKIGGERNSQEGRYAEV